MRTVPTSETATILGNGSGMPSPPITTTAATPSNGTANPIHAMIAGYLAGSSGTIVGYPLDSLKVWVQTNSLGKNMHLDSSSKLKSNSNRSNNNSNNKHQKQKAGWKPSKDSASGSSSSGKWSKSKSKKVLSAKGSSSPNCASSSRRSNSTKAIDPLAAAAQQHQQQHASSFRRNAFLHRATLYRRFLAKPFSRAYGVVRALYSGVTGPLVTVGMVQSVNFATYDATRRFLYRSRVQRERGTDTDTDTDIDIDPREYLTEDSIGAVALSGSVGGMATAVMTAPLLMIKIRQQITGHSFRRAFREIFFAEDASTGKRRFRPFRPYGAAFLPHSLSEATGRAIYVSSYEGFKRHMVRRKNNNQNHHRQNQQQQQGNEEEEVVFTTSSLSLRERMVCAAGSGISCWGIFFPIDALRNRMYDATSRNTASSATGAKAANSIVETLKVMRAEKAFYRGYPISMVRAGPVAASVLPVYDMTLEKLSAWQ